MKKLLSIFAIILVIALKSKAQIYSPSLAGFAGPSTIFYPNGYYQGGVYNGFANGSGTFYWYDGSFFSGNFYGGFYNGPGVMVSRFYGYVSGCWSGGVFIGNCVNVYNPYNNNNKVQSEITRVQQSLPNDQRVKSYDPDGYAITRVDPNTQMGKTLLGRSNN